MFTMEEEIQFLERALLISNPENIDFYRKGESFLPDLYHAVTEDCITMSDSIQQAAFDLLNEIFSQCRVVMADEKLNAETIEDNYVKNVFPYVYYCKHKEVKIASDDSYYIFSYVSALLSAMDGISEDVVHFASFIKAYIRRVNKGRFLQRAEAVVEDIKKRKGLEYDFSPNPSIEEVANAQNMSNIYIYFLHSKESVEKYLLRFYSIEEQNTFLEAVVQEMNNYEQIELLMAEELNADGTKKVKGKDYFSYMPSPICTPSEIEEIRENINAGKYLKASLRASSSALAPPSPGKKLSDSEKLASPQAQQLWAQAQQRGWVDNNSKPLLPNTEAAFMADRMAQILGIRCKWKTFGEFWGMKPDSLRSAYNKALDKSTMLDFQDELKDAFHL